MARVLRSLKIGMIMAPQYAEAFENVSLKPQGTHHISETIVSGTIAQCVAVCEMPL